MAKCVLCRSDRQDPIQYGEFMVNGGISVHTNCLYLSSGLSQRGADDEDFCGFLLRDVLAEQQRVSVLRCCYCGKSGANIGCCEKRCRNCFHMICGMEHGAVNQYMRRFNSYCQKHAPPDKYKPPADEKCCICYDQLLKTNKSSEKTKVIRAACCGNGWFHRLCLQKYAHMAGYFFKCPLCNENKNFVKHVSCWGVFVPQRDAAWELEPNAYAELLERPNECSALQCRNSSGRRNNGNNTDPLLLCETCGSVAMHRCCIVPVSDKFRCDTCCQLPGADSGRESMYSQQTEEANEDEFIDVCGKSDESEVENSSEDELSHHTLSHRKIRSRLRLSSEVDNSSDDELSHHTLSRRKIRSRLRLSSFEDKDADQNECKRETPLKTDPSITVGKEQDVIQKPTSHVNALSFAVKSLECTSNKAADEEESDSDDPLEKAFDNIECRSAEFSGASSSFPRRRRPSRFHSPLDVSCISSRSRRNSTPLTADKDGSASSSNNKIFTQSNHDEQENKSDQRNVANSPIPTKRFRFVDSSTDTTVESGTSLDISCIARRTRRRSTINHSGAGSSRAHQRNHNLRSANKNHNANEMNSTDEENDYLSALDSLSGYSGDDEVKTPATSIHANRFYKKQSRGERLPSPIPHSHIHRSFDPYIAPRFIRVNGKLKKVGKGCDSLKSTPPRTNLMRSYSLLLGASMNRQRLVR